MPSSYCDQFKNLGYTVYVVYTPYNPNMHSYFLNYLGNIAIGNGAGTITNNLKACSSDPANDYISAEDAKRIEERAGGLPAIRAKFANPLLDVKRVGWAASQPTTNAGLDDRRRDSGSVAGGL